MQREHAGTMSVEILYNSAQMVEELHLKSPATFKIIQGHCTGAIWLAIYDFLLVFHCKLYRSHAQFSKYIYYVIAKS